MELQKGDWVRTEKGVVGQVVLVNQMSVDIEVDKVDGQGTQVLSYIPSALTKIDPPVNRRESK